MSGVLLLAAATCLAPNSDALVGFWESKEASKGGIGHALEFRLDGTAVASTTVIVNLVYRVSKDRVFVGEDADPAKHSESRFQIEGDTLLLTGPGDGTVRKERFGVRGSGERSIVGTWRYPHDTGATAYERYTDDGLLLFRLPITADVGCYAVAGGTVSLTKPAMIASFEVRDGQLLLARDGKGPLVYVRVAAGPWYPRDPEELRAP